MRQYSFFLKKEQSPTYHNLSTHLLKAGWRSSSLDCFADISEKNFQLDLPAMECLEYKHSLAKLVDHYCPHVMPTTYVINDNNWLMVLKKILNDHGDKLTWILKPALMNNGQHIKIFQYLHQLEAHYISSQRMGGVHVLQRYITDPHLLKGPERGHKYSLRLFVILTNYAGAYLYPKGYFNVALTPYQADDFTRLSSHLTNEHLSDDSVNVVQIPTQQYDLFHSFYPKIKSISADVINALQKKHPFFSPDNPRALAIFGFDFMVDQQEQVWLLEANHGPCFPVNDDHPLQKKLYDDFWQEVAKSFVLPIAMHQPINQIQYDLFELIA